MPNFVIDKIERKAALDVLKKFTVRKLGYSLRRADIFFLQHKYEYMTAHFNIGLDDLYLRFGDCRHAAPDHKSIVVARIGFRQTKRGHGTELLKVLCMFGQRFGYEFLQVECPNPDCQAFMRKLGFKDTHILPIGELRNSIQEYELLRQTEANCV